MAGTIKFCEFFVEDREIYIRNIRKKFPIFGQMVDLSIILREPDEKIMSSH